jgi:S1-C subfamily serine protease
MMRFLFLVAALMFSFDVTAAVKLIGTDAPVAVPAEQINSGMNMAQKRVREASVRINTAGGGHGTGSYIVYKDAHLIFTAQHVADGSKGGIYHVSKGGESRIATLIWSDAAADMAVLHLSEKFVTISPMKWSPQKRLAEVGTEITYSGYPSHHQLMTFQGVVAGYEDKSGVGKQIILNTYGWFGCSGSVIYALNGDIVGILYAVDVEYYPGLQVQENMIWVAPIQRIDMKVVLRELCKVEPYAVKRACR